MPTKPKPARKSLGQIAYEGWGTDTGKWPDKPKVDRDLWNRIAAAVERAVLRRELKPVKAVRDAWCREYVKARDAKVPKTLKALESAAMDWLDSRRMITNRRPYVLALDKAIEAHARFLAAKGGGKK